MIGVTQGQRLGARRVGMPNEVRSKAPSDRVTLTTVEFRLSAWEGQPMTFDTERRRTDRIWHRHGMPDAGTDQRLSRASTALTEVGTGGVTIMLSMVNGMATRSGQTQ